MATNFITGGIWTRTRIAEAGYSLPEGTKCPLCEDLEDIVEHRLFECTHLEVAEARVEILRPWMSKWLRGQVSVLASQWASPSDRHREDTARSLARQGLARHPGLGQPQPAQDGVKLRGTQPQHSRAEQHSQMADAPTSSTQLYPGPPGLQER